MDRLLVVGLAGTVGGLIGMLAPWARFYDQMPERFQRSASGGGGRDAYERIVRSRARMALVMSTAAAVIGGVGVLLG